MSHIFSKELGACYYPGIMLGTMDAKMSKIVFSLKHLTA